MKQKLLLLILPMVLFTLVSSAQDKTWDFANDAVWVNPTAAATASFTTDGLTFFASGASAYGQILASTILDYSDGFVIGGDKALNHPSASSGSGGALPTTRYMTFPVTGPCTIKIWAYSGSSGRVVKVSDGTTVAGSVTLSEGAASPATARYRITGGTISYTGGATTLYVYATNSLTYHKITVTYPKTTWDGATWSAGAPTATTEAIIAGDYDTATDGAITAKKLTVNSGVLTINSGATVTVQNEVINAGGSVIVENNANLIQVNNTTNTGNITVNRNSNSLFRLDYTMWSSPVSGSQTLANFSPVTSTNRFYEYNTATDLFSAVSNTGTFTTAKGYLIRMPNENIAAGYNAGTSPIVFSGVFTGVPNNGTVSLTGLTSDKYYAVGNPYPSVISAESFLDGNATADVLYFWRKTNLAGGSAYATYTNGGATTTTATSATPNGTIQVGQGFIVKTGLAATTLTFTNAMRQAAPTSTQFFKTKKLVDRNRIWLNLTNQSGVFSQMLVGYFADATEGVDAGIDGKYINDSKVALTSSINGAEYTIQGRAPFNASDVVSLIFKTDVAGEYTIAIDHVDGLFAMDQDVYLVDNATGTVTDLKAGSYTFTAAAGVDSDRFSLKYQKTLGLETAAFTENNVMVYKNKGTMYVNAGDTMIKNVKVYDIQGRLVAELKDVKSTTASVSSLKAANQVLIFKVTAQDNKVVSKKVLY